MLLGPNGSGKSTIFDVFNFLSECFTVGLRPAWGKRGRFRELRSRGSTGPIVFELRYRETPAAPPAIYHLGTLGRLAKNPRVAALRRFIENWHVSYVSIDDTRGQPEAGAQEHLTKTGDNLANVIQFLKEQYSTQLDRSFTTLRARVPQLETVISEPLADGRLLLR